MVFLNTSNYKGAYLWVLGSDCPRCVQGKELPVTAGPEMPEPVFCPPGQTYSSMEPDLQKVLKFPQIDIFGMRNFHKKNL